MAFKCRNGLLKVVFKGVLRSCLMIVKACLKVFKGVVKGVALSFFRFCLGCFNVFKAFLMAFRGVFLVLFWFV